MFLTGRNTTHYCYIRSLSRLLYSEYDAGRRLHFYERCLQGFSSERVLNDHLFYCREVNDRPVRTEMPKEGENTLFFENYQNQMKKPWVIYADFESIVERIHGCFPDPGQSSTSETSVHNPCGFCMLAVRSDGETKGPYLYRGADVVQGFLNYLQLLEREIREELRAKAPLNMTRADWVDFNRARDCHICSKPLVKENQRDAIEVHDPDTRSTRALFTGIRTNVTKRPTTCTFKTHRVNWMRFHLSARETSNPRNTLLSRKTASSVVSPSCAEHSETQLKTTATSQASIGERPTKPAILTTSE